MASSDDDLRVKLQEVAQRLRDDPAVPRRVDADDLGQLHIEAHQAKVHGGFNVTATEEVQLIGVIHTISDRKPIDLEIDGGRMIRVRRGEVDFSPFLLHQRIRVTAELTVSTQEGDRSSEVYRAMAVSPLEDQ